MSQLGSSVSLINNNSLDLIISQINVNEKQWSLRLIFKVLTLSFLFVFVLILVRSFWNNLCPRISDRRDMALLFCLIYKLLEAMILRDPVSGQGSCIEILLGMLEEISPVQVTIYFVCTMIRIACARPHKTSRLMLRIGLLLGISQLFS